ncbi:ATP-binding cassette domain-containing protein [Crossiella sp. CA-258035]|uniref:ABC transporter ATP-binding protein n=1 Tax=Crossiella sp. CA-258035 TaxID=2981138 RepID=UPI0024BCDA0A|nr:ATP-binding cassette domain-containing protein [Crossiella sp. CA-258035]WHT16969.1 ATP-binding cassette domain-containing protein [Crossiella sp. CA-258035]
MIASVTDLVITGPAGRRLVDGLSFTVAEGEVVALVGRSGSGKTTAALALLGHLRPGLSVHSGLVKVAGTDMFADLTAPDLRGQVISYLGQDPKAGLNPARRLRNQLADTARDPAETTALLHRLNLPADPGFLRRYPHQVSGGQAQRIALAIALAAMPRLLVLDEPTSGLDTRLAVEFRAVLKDHLRRTKAAAVVISHDANLVRDLARKVVSLDRAPAAQSVAQAAAVVRTPGRPLLSVRELSATHDRTPVLRDLSFDLAAGECLALTGPSGSGKTTAARCLVGLHRPSHGRITLHSPAPRRRAIALVAQDSLGALNPREPVRTALSRPLRLPRADRAAEVTRLLRRVHLDPGLAEHRPARLSGGERQRVNLARALAAGPEVLVCDEITSALDPGTRTAILDLLDELRDTLGLAIVLISHDQAVVDRMADRVVRL